MYFSNKIIEFIDSHVSIIDSLSNAVERDVKLSLGETMRCLDALAKISVLFFSHKVSCNSFSRKSRENKELYIF